MILKRALVRSAFVKSRLYSFLGYNITVRAGWLGKHWFWDCEAHRKRTNNQIINIPGYCFPDTTQAVVKVAHGINSNAWWDSLIST